MPISDPVRPRMTEKLQLLYGDRAPEVLARIDEVGGPVALIVQPPARRALASLLRQRARQCQVLSINELPATQPVEVIATIGAEAAPEGLPAPDAPQAPPAQEMAA